MERRGQLAFLPVPLRSVKAIQEFPHSRRSRHRTRLPVFVGDVTGRSTRPRCPRLGSVMSLPWPGPRFPRLGPLVFRGIGASVDLTVAEGSGVVLVFGRGEVVLGDRIRMLDHRRPLAGRQGGVVRY